MSQEEDDIGTDNDRGPHLGLGLALGYAWLARQRAVLDLFWFHLEDE